jgi:hypothetical protein
MGEAKRRKLAGTYPTQISDQTFSAAEREQIAAVARSLDVIIPEPGGLCLYRALAGQAALRVLGVTAQLAVGGMIYRAGPNPLRDHFAFAGPDGGIAFHEGALLGHVWLDASGVLIDFSPGDWVAVVSRTPDAGNAAQEPVQWTAPPPPFFWGPRTNFQPSPGLLVPPQPGQAWYFGRTADAAAAQAWAQKAIDNMLSNAFMVSAIKEIATGRRVSPANEGSAS